MSNYRCQRKFYSAEPLFLLDSRVKYPRELVAGPFLLFVKGGNLAGTGQEFDLQGRIVQWNPDVVIWGYFLGAKASGEDGADRAIRDYALERKFQVVPIGFVDGHDLYLAYRSDCKTRQNAPAITSE